MKKGFYIGALFGGLSGVIIALTMDLLLGNALGGGWKDAVAHDLAALTGKAVDPQSWVVFSGVAVIVGIIGLVGAAVGGFFGVLLARLLSFLTK